MPLIITPENLPAALALAMSRGSHDGLFTASMDHSPSEQLIGRADLWHTTALIVSSAIEHANLAQRVAERLRPRHGTLTEWRRATNHYRANFLKVMVEEMRSVGNVQVFAISAQESAIRSSVAHCTRELRLDSVYRLDPGNGARVQIGPVWKQGNPDPIEFTLARGRAEICVFLAHFITRMHRAMFAALAAADPPAGQVHWNFLADKLPGPHDADMELLMRVALSHRECGNLRWGYFVESDSVGADLLADNAAGALARAVADPRGFEAALVGPEPASSSTIYWERWE